MTAKIMTSNIISNRRNIELAGKRRKRKATAIMAYQANDSNISASTDPERHR